MANRFLYLVRHAQHHQGERDKGKLTPCGRRQARLTAQALRGIPFDGAYSSNVRRAVRTAQIILEGFPDVELQRTDLLRECVPSVPPRLVSWRELRNRSPKSTDIPPEACVEQLEEAVRHFLSPVESAYDTHELLVCHGNVIRYLVVRALDVSPDAWVKLAIHNCGIARIAIEASGERMLISYNDIGHLPADLCTHN